MKFTQDWFSHNIPNFEFCMSALETKQDFLEIGCFEGRASVWMLQNGLDPDGKLTCIDTFQGSEEHANLEFDNLFHTFGANITNILFPSIFGILSSAPTSFKLSANFKSKISPLSLNIIALPLNCT